MSMDGIKSEVIVSFFRGHIYISDSITDQREILHQGTSIIRAGHLPFGASKCDTKKGEGSVFWPLHVEDISRKR